MVRFNLILPDRLSEAMRVLAERLEMTLSEVVRRALEAYLEQQREKEGTRR